MVATKATRRIVRQDGRVTGKLVPWVLMHRAKWESLGLEISNVRTIGSKGFLRDSREMYFTLRGPEDVVDLFERAAATYKDSITPVQLEYVASSESYEATADLFRAYFGAELKKPRPGRGRATTAVTTNMAAVREFKDAMGARGIPIGAVK